MWISGCPAAVISYLPRIRGVFSLQADTIRLVPARHVGKNYRVAFVKSLKNLNRIHRFASHLDRDAHSLFAVRVQLEQADSTVFLPECMPPHINHIVQPLQVDSSVYA